MDCRKFQKNLEDYLQGGLDFAGRFGMERHAQQCFGCGKDVADAQKLAEWARELRKAKAPQNFEATVLARIQSRKATRRRFPVPWIYRWELSSWRLLAYGLPVAAAVVIAVAVGVPWLRQQGNRPELSDSGGPALSLQNPDGDRAVQPFAARTSSSPFAVADKHISPLTAEDVSVPIDAEPGDTGFVEYMVPGPGDRPVIMRLPRSVRMRYGPPSEEYFMRNVSH